ncbi:TPA: hypothetical protein N0F65_007640 [Lagenidium giganteum]|uniref:Peroxisomal ATPase PEX6 n=1 Tax=Lagenidium giganteum TaxID=4803 RepID=A0AAV2Z8T6_9STRA|nr:TPA: hypothetical protein N0F65_007640 [Lagenidium giganteum]
MTITCSAFLHDDSGVYGAGLDSSAPQHPAIDVQAFVWGSESLDPTFSRLVLAVDGAQLADDQLTAVVTNDIAVLKQLQVFSGSYVVVQAGNDRRHVARLLFSRGEAAAPKQVVATPLLAFNLGLPLHAVKGDHVSAHLTLRAAWPQEIGLGATVYRRTRELLPADAAKAVIAPLYVSSVSCQNHALMRSPDGLLNAVRWFFRTKRVLQAGDIFAVPLCERYPYLPKATDAADAFQVVRIPPPFAVESSSIADEASATNVSTLVTTRCASVVVDTALVFFRVESLQHSTWPTSPELVALAVSDTTEVLQSTAVTSRAPDEQAIRKFLHTCSHKQLPRWSGLDLQQASLDRMYELLYPSQVCQIPVSVLLSGPRGVGKTALVHQVAKLLGVFVLEVPFTELTASSELHLLENMRNIVAKAQNLAPSLLYISRFFPVDKANEEAELRIGAALSEGIRALATHSNQTNIPLIACVEDVTDVPKFIRQCFLYELTLETPDLTTRKEMLRQLSETSEFDADVDLSELAQLTAGRTCGEIVAIVADAGALAIERTLEDGPCGIDELESASITSKDLEVALRNQAKSSPSKISNASIPNVKWEDVGGLEDVKEEILDVVQLPLKHPELFASGVRQRSGILLYGPPGTGKTLLAKAIATECNMNFLSVKGPELLNMYIGESEKNVRQVFAKARSCRPCILFFDELDSLAPMRGRGSDSGGVMDRVVSQLLTEIDGLSGGGNDQVFVIGATNRPDLLETGLLRPGRFDRLLYLGICNEKSAQLKVVQALTRKFHMAPDVNLNAIIAQCPLNFTGADFYALCSTTLASALKDRVANIDKQLDELNAADCYSSNRMTARALLNKLPPEELRVAVNQHHFLNALEQVVPSVSPAELQHYERLKDQYSSKRRRGRDLWGPCESSALPTSSPTRRAPVAMRAFVLLLVLLGVCHAFHSHSWASHFAARSGEALPIPAHDCRVCFYEKADYEGESVCIGLRSLQKEMDILPIEAPSSIGSIKFFKDTCDPVLILRVLVPPFGQRFVSVTEDQPAPAFHDIVEELYLEWDGTACLYGPAALHQYGRCYHDNIADVGDPWSTSFYELLMFKVDMASLDIVLYEHKNYNHDEPGWSKRFWDSSRDFTIHESNDPSDASLHTLSHNVASVQFICPKIEQFLL